MVPECDYLDCRTDVSLYVSVILNSTTSDISTPTMSISNPVSTTSTCSACDYDNTTMMSDVPFDISDEPLQAAIILVVGLSIGSVLGILVSILVCIVCCLLCRHKREEPRREQTSKYALIWNEKLFNLWGTLV